MNAKKIAIRAALSAVVALGSAAHADTYSFSYIANDLSLTASGQFTTSGSAITGITGNVSGLGAIAGLLGTPGNYGNDGVFQWDNTLFAGPSLSTNGVLFSVVGDLPGREWNLWGNGGTSASLWAAIPGQGYSPTTDGKLNIAAVPEPETYALMLAGLGAIGFLARRRKASV